MNFDIFSNNENYLMENIPKNMNYFKKKKWIKEKLAFMGHAKSLVFADKNHILCAFLDANEEYWLPAEKVKFYLYVFQEQYPYIIIAEELHDQTYYYGLLHNFLIIFTKDYDEAIENMRAYSKGKEIKILGIGNIDLACDKKMEFNEIYNLIMAKDKTYDQKYNNLQNIDDELIYLNEEHMNYQGATINEEPEYFKQAFLYWFNNLKHEKHNRKYYLATLIIGMLGLFMADLYCGYQKMQIKKEIDITIQKINICDFDKK